MRVTHVITSLGVGGAELMLSRLLSRLEPQGFHSEVICLGAMGEVGHQILALGVRVRVLGMSRAWPSPLAVWKLARTIRQFRPDVVQTWMYHANLLGSLACWPGRRVPIVWGLRQANLDQSVNRPRTLRIARACAHFSSIPAAIICNSEAGRRSHAVMGYAMNKMCVIPNGFDTDVFRPDPISREAVRRELGVSSDTLLVGLVARFDVQKDQATFVAAAGLVARARQDVRFVLCGNNITWRNAELTRCINEAGIRDRCALLGPRDDVPRLMASFDIAVSSSCGEGFPNAVGEAMACGIPCVVTDVGDSAMLLGAGGRVVPPRNSRALAAAALELLELSAEERRRLGLQARARIVEEFSLDSVANAYAALYRALAAQTNTTDCPERRVVGSV